MTSGGGMGGSAAVVHVDIVGRFDEFENRINQLEAQSSDAGERAGKGFGGKFHAGLAIAAGGAVALAGAITAVGAAVVDLAGQAGQNVNDFQAKLGASREEAEHLGKVAENVFGNNFGGNLKEAGEAVGEVRQQLGDLADDELQKVTEGALALKDTFGIEVPDSVSAMKTLMKEFGLTSQQATDFITKGFQDGLNRSGDFLDSINEYSTQFANGGASAEEFWNLMKNGAQGGALGTDKAADAFKEFRVRIQDGSKGVAEALENLGINSEELANKMAKGQITAADAFKLVQKKLGDVKDENLRMQAGVALIGTQYEDLGQKGAAALSMTGKSLKDMAGATDSLNAKYNNLGQFFEGMWRKVQVSLLPVGKELLGLANEAAPYLQKAFDQVGQKLPSMIKQGITSAKEFGTTAVNVYNSVKPAIETTVVSVQKLSSFIERNKEVLIPLTAAVSAGVATYGIYRAGVLAIAVAQTAWTATTTAATAASVALRAALTFITGPVGLAITAITLLVGAGVALYRNWDEVVAWAQKTWSRIKGIVSDAIGGATAYLKGINMHQVGLDIVQGLVNGILAGPRLVLAAARGLGSAVINGVKSILNIQSPSRVMKELGEFTAEGFVVGIESKRPNVKQAAQETAKDFMAAFSDLKLERATGSIDLTTYTKTLEQAATTLRGKLKTVQEGTPAYTEWLKALTGVQKELDVVKAKSSTTQQAAKGLADEMKRGRDQIAQGEATEKYVTGLKKASDAQLAAALATARASGEVDKYNAIHAEQKRRTDVVTAAQEKATEAAKRHQQQLADNRAQIAASEAQERYLVGLRSATDAQLASALATARAGGETDKYNSIKQEQKRRSDAVAAAHEKAADAAKREALAVSEGRKAISEGREYEQWKKGLEGMTVAQLRASASSLEAAGNQRRYADVMTELERRSDEVSKKQEHWAENLSRLSRTEWVEGLKNLSDAELLAGLEAARAGKNTDDYNAYLTETQRRADEAAKSHERWTDNLDKIAHDDWVQGLKKLSDSELAAGLAAARASENTDDYNAYLAETERRSDDASKAHERWTDNLDKISRNDWAKGLKDLSDAELLAGLSAAKSSENVDDYNAYLTETQRRTDEAAKAHERWTDNLDKISRGEWAKGLRDLSDSELAAGLAATRASENTDDYNTYLAETQRRADEAVKAHKSWTDNLEKVSRKEWVEGLKNLSDAELLAGLNAAQAGENLEDYNAYLTETQRRTDEAQKTHTKWLDNLEKISRGEWTKGLKNLSDAELLASLNAARASENLEDYNAYLTETQRRADEATKSHEKWADNLAKIGHDEWVMGLKNLSDAELAAGLEAAKAGEKTDDYNTYLAESKRRGDEAAKNTDLLTEARRKLTEVQEGGARPFASELAALEAMRGKPGVVASELNELLAAYQRLQSETERKKGLEEKINLWGNYAKQIVPVVGAVFSALSGNTSDVADQWASDLGNMTNDLVQFGSQVATGNWAGAAVTVLTTIFNWFSRNKKAAEDAAKATKAYTDQFKFAQDVSGNNDYYGTRTVEKTTTGMLFWKTDHYTEHIDTLKRNIAMALEGGFADGMRSGFEDALAKNDFSDFGKNLKTSVGKAVTEGLIESFMQQELLKNTIGPAIKQYLQDGNVATLNSAVSDATAKAEDFYNRVLAPIANQFGLLGTAPASQDPLTSNSTTPTNTIQTVKVEMPKVEASLNFDVLGTLAAAVERSAPIQSRFSDTLEKALPALDRLGGLSGKLDSAAQAMLSSSGLDVANTSRLERLLTGAELKPQGSYK